jgi:hypothetical protein
LSNKGSKVHVTLGLSQGTSAHRRRAITIEVAKREATNVGFAADFKRIGSHFVNGIVDQCGGKNLYCAVFLEMLKRNDKQGVFERECSRRREKVTNIVPAIRFTTREREASDM